MWKGDSDVSSFCSQRLSSEALGLKSEEKYHLVLDAASYSWTGHTECESLARRAILESPASMVRADDSTPTDEPAAAVLACPS